MKSNPLVDLLASGFRSMCLTCHLHTVCCLGGPLGSRWCGRTGTLDVSRAWKR